MKKYRVSYEIADGKYLYLSEIVVDAEEMTLEVAAEKIVPEIAWEYDQETGNDLARAIISGNGSALLPDGRRMIHDVFWEEVHPVVITVRAGIIKDIRNIPDDIEIKVVDWDTDTLDEWGNPVPAVTVWDKSGEYAADGDGEDNDRK